MQAPPDHVLAAFGVGDPTLLPGGTGRSWAAGHLVLKPLDLAPANLEWQAEILATIEEEGFRVAPPEPRIVDGWTAWRRVEGEHRAGAWRETIAVGERFHAALAHLARPPLLDERDDPWSIGDRAAWGELPLDPWLGHEPIAILASRLEPYDAPSSLIHGDLTGNVLYADGLDPAVIDFSPYWRPPAFASAIVVGDALLWEHAPRELASAAEPRLLVRALLYRAVTELVAHGALTSEYERALG